MPYSTETCKLRFRDCRHSTFPQFATMSKYAICIVAGWGAGVACARLSRPTPWCTVRHMNVREDISHVVASRGKSARTPTQTMKMFLGDIEGYLREPPPLDDVLDPDGADFVTFAVYPSVWHYALQNVARGSLASVRGSAIVDSGNRLKVCIEHDDDMTFTHCYKTMQDKWNRSQ
jgi:hypothetical protein